MDKKKFEENQKNRFYKLSLNKNRHKIKDDVPEFKRTSDIIILDESFDQLRLDVPKNFLKNQVVGSPIVIDDSLELSNDCLPEVSLQNTPTNMGNNSFCSAKDLSPAGVNSRPSVEGWSPAQNMMCVTPRHRVTPSTPKEVANESLEECSIKKIEQSQKKILNDLYGKEWKSIPALFKTIKRNLNQFDSISKKLQFDDEDDSDKENVRHRLREHKKLYLTGSGAKHKVDLDRRYPATERKSKKKLYTELIPQTPEPPKPKVKNVKVNVKKDKRDSVGDMIEMMMTNVNSLTKEIGEANSSVTRLTFMASLADNVPSWRCHIDAIQYRDNYKTLREQLTRRLFQEFNKVVFDNAFEADMPIVWDTKLRSTAGTTTNRLIKNSNGERIRTSSIKLSTKVVDAPQRLRDTLVHELCHAATWLVDGELRAGHGPLWRNWAKRALRAIPELGEISRCHDLEIHFKYSYKCTRCGYSVKRHSKSIDTTKKCCGYCNGTFELIVNRRNKDGAIVSTPARKAPPNEFAMFVKEKYSTVKEGRTHAQVMKLLGEQFSTMKSSSKDI